MNTKALAGFVGAGLLAFASSAMAQALFDNFDTYTLGLIEGQGGWESWTGYSGITGVVSTDQASSGTQSLKVVSGQDTVHPFSGVNSGLWRLSLQQYIPSTSSGDTLTILMNSYPNNLNWSAQVLADISQGLIGVFDGTGTQAGKTLLLVKDRWVDMYFDIDLSANSVSVHYNNLLMATYAWQTGGINELQALDIYPSEDPTYKQVGPVYYDNVRLEMIPEPATAGLLVLGGLALLFRSRKQA